LSSLLAFLFLGARCISILLENAVFQQLGNWGKEIYYFSEKKEVDFVCKEGLKIMEIINVCYHLDDKETLIRETSALIEGTKYFNLKRALIVIGEGRKNTFTGKGVHISMGLRPLKLYLFQNVHSEHRLLIPLPQGTRLLGSIS